MKLLKFALLLALVGAPLPALAAPFIVSDATVTTTITHCAWYIDAARTLVAAPKDATGKPYCKVDVVDMIVGAHTIQAAFVITSDWGSEEGPKSLPFALTRPAAPTSSPSGLKLIP